MRSRLLFIFLVISIASIGQNSGVLGKKNEIKFQFQTNPFTAKNRTYSTIRELQDGIWSKGRSGVYNYKSFLIGYSRIVSRKVSIGLNYSYGYGRLGRLEAAYVDQMYTGNGFAQINCFDSPQIKLHDFEIISKVHFLNHAPFGFYALFGLGSGFSQVKQRMSYFFDSNSDYTTLLNKAYEVDGDLLLYNFDFVFGIGGNIFLSRYFSLNFECDFKVKGFYHTIRNEFSNPEIITPADEELTFDPERQSLLSATKRHKNFTDAFNLGIGFSFWF